MSPVVVRVGAVEEVTVPAGTFQARRIDIGGDQAQTCWVAVDGPRVPVLIRPAGRPVSIELRSVGDGSGR